MHHEWAELSAETAAGINNTRKHDGRVIAVGTTSVRVLETAAQKSNGDIAAWSGETDLFIRPPYEFKAIDGMLTNFHLPKSTLLVLVRTLGGDKLIRQAYAEAIQEQYRLPLKRTKIGIRRNVSTTPHIIQN